MLDPIPQRQLNLGPAGWFRPEAESPAGNQVRVKAGFLFAGGFRVYDRFTGGDQLTAGFASVSGAGFKRYDLVYLDATGVAQIAQGTEVALAAPDFQGAPGFTGGPDMPDQANPVAYVLVDEVGAVTVDTADITQINGIHSMQREFDGFFVDKGLLGAAPTGANDVVTTLFTGETSGGSTSSRGIVTSAPSNRVDIRDQDGDAIEHISAGGATIYGRITFSVGVWTLSYFYINASGVETAVASIQAESINPLTDLRLAAVPKVYSRNDPARPLFNSDLYRLTDQVVGVPGIGSVPIGGVISWMNPNPASINPSPPAGYEYCDGTLVTTAGSPMLGATKPNMMTTSAGGTQRFIRGANTTVAYGTGTAFVTGGADSGAGGSTTTNGAHTHSVSAHTHAIFGDGLHTHTGTTGFAVSAGANGLQFETASSIPDGHTHSFTTASDGSHNHGGVTDGGSGGTDSQGDHFHTFAGFDNRPAFVELASIVRVL